MIITEGAEVADLNKGFFITFEGPDGSGKTTQVKLFAEYLREKGYDVLVTREPGGTEISEQIRNLIMNTGYSEESPLTEMLLFAAQRAQNVFELLRPALNDGKTVVCDRFVDSSIAYQGYGRMLGEQVSIVNEIAVQGCMPDMTFFLDISPEAARERNKATTKDDRLELESEAFRERVYKAYKLLEQIHKDRYINIDASKNIEEVQQQIRDKFDKRTAAQQKNS